MTSTPVWTPLPRFGYGFAIYPFTPGAQTNSSDSTKEPQEDIQDNSPSDPPEKQGTPFPEATDSNGLSYTNGSSDTSSISSENSNSYIVSYQVSLEVGDEVYVFEEQGAWYRGYVVSQLRQTEEPQVYVGIFPMNHVYIKEYLEDLEFEVDNTNSSDSSPEGERINRPPPPLPSLKCGDDTISGKTEPLVDEIASTVREWSSLLPKYLEERKYKMFRTVKDQINNLLQGRRQLLAQTLSQDELSKLRKELINKLVSGNLIQDLDIIVRNPERGFLADETNISAIRLYQLHSQLSLLNVDKSKSEPLLMSPTSPSLLTPSGSNYFHSQGSTTTENVSHAPKFYHVFLDLKAWVASISAPGEYTELYFSLYTKNDSKFITEEYFIILNHNGVPKDESKIGKIRTIFTDLSPHDIQEQIYLVCRIVRTGSMKLSDKDKENTKEGGSMTSLFSKPTKDMDQADQLSISNGRSIPQTFRRPFGCAVLEISHLLQGKEKETLSEHVMPIYVPVQESTFATLHEDIINSRAKELEKSPRAEMVSVSLRPYYGETAIIIKENPALLQDIPITSRLGFADVVFPGDTRNEIYLKLLSGDFTQGRSTTAKNIQMTAEVKLNTGEVLENVISQGAGEPKVSQFDSLVFYHSNNPLWGELIKLNIPVELFEQAHVFFTFRHRSTKDKKEDKIFAFAYMPLFPENRAFISDGKHSLILYKYDKQWINPSVYLKASWSPTATFSDTVSTHSSINSHSSHKMFPSSKDTVVIGTFLCSTKYTQNEVLLKLLNWEKQLMSDINEMMSVLKKFTFVGEVEIVKFLQDIFDALFGILVSTRNQHGELDDLIFNALVTILGIVSDRRFMNFRPVLDVYIEKHFSCAAASSHLIRSMNRLVSNPTSPETAQSLRSAIKVWQYIFKIIMRSRELQRTKESNMGLSGNYVEEQFKKELFSLFRSVDRLMSITTPQSIIGTQTLALQHFASIFADLGKCFTPDDLVQIAIRFTESVRLPKGKLLAYKLLVILQFCRGPLFENAESRAILLRRVVEWVADHMGKWERTGKQNGDSDSARMQWQDGIRLCVTIIAVMLESLQCSIERSTEEAAKECEIENVKVILPLVVKLCESYRELHITADEIHPQRDRTASSGAVLSSAMFSWSYPLSGITTPTPTVSSYRHSKEFLLSPLQSSFSSGLGEIAAVILQIMFLLSQEHMKEHLLSTYYREGHDATADFLTLLFLVSRSILLNEAFPESWLNMNIMAHKVFLKFLEPISTLMEKNYIPDKDAPDTFNEQLWREYFTCLLALLTSKHLIIENFTPQKRRAIWRLAGDLRGRAAKLLSTLWDAIGWEHGKDGKMGGYQVRFINTLLGPILELCLSHHDELRSAAITVLFSMILTQYTMDEDFKQMESDIIDTLDKLFMSENKGDEISRAYFIAQLRNLFENNSVEKALRETVIKFLDSLSEFLELLLGVRDLPEGEEFQDDRIMCTLKLMKFIKSIDREQIYIKYVHQLVQLQVHSHNFVEAALTLKLHSDLYDWDPNSEVEALPEMDFPKQSPFDRKERLYIQILDYFVKGKAWECGIEICKELARHFEYTTYDYQRLSNILKQQAVLHENVIKKERYFSEYFRVGFYGRGFPASLQNRQFIYRGYEWEKIGAFCERMLNKHSQAALLKSNCTPSDEILYEDGQFLQVTAVVPEPDSKHPVFKSGVPSSIKAYYEHNSVNTFSFSRPVNKNPDGVKSSNEFLDLWTEKTIMVSEDHFPTVLRRSEIIENTVIEVSPIENAVAAMNAKNRELKMLEAKYHAFLTSSKGVGKINTNPLSMSLNGAVDAPVNGGVPMYKKAFFGDDFLTTNPDKGVFVNQLKEAIDEQVDIIDRCLEIHDRLVSADMRPLHDTLVKFFLKNFTEEINRLAERRNLAESKVMTLSRSSASSLVFFPPPIKDTNKPFFISNSPMNTLNTEQTTPMPPTNSSVITRVAAAATFNNISRNSINTQGNMSMSNHSINYNKRMSESSEGSNGNYPPISPNGDTITEIPVIEKRPTLKERKGSIVFGERRKTMKGWPFNRNRSTTQ
ncbi:6358_t:CDS:2 [Funneliformis caledonium]|uniref:6358_t:CDS:1 n=1 Tax=Funneliformis caledonium TaxID=1117310 RepID=A0A9N9B2Z4_9GLOM|nr:6358_t:CDS:2 [Funneliformis caledonium]